MRLFPAILALTCTTSAALAAPPAIVTDLPVTGSLVAMVMGDLGAPHVLLPQGADAHDYQLRPSDAAALQAAGLLIWVGPEMTPWLNRAAGQITRGNSLALLQVQGTHRQDFAAGGQDHPHDDHSHDHDHDHSHAHDHGHDHSHDHSGTDPHAWLDPHNAQLWLAAIRDALTAADPENAAAYAANAQAAAARIEELDARITAQLAPVAGKPFVVMHDAYGYFTGHYGLTPAIPVSLGDAAAPSAAQIAAIREQIGAQNIACIFPEPISNPRLIAAITEGTAIRTGAPLDPEGTAQNQGADLYPAMLAGLADALAGCLESTP
ncbi:MAG: zinc ABC transporter substrate-binding protein [Paracoccus sp. (in: a-proteobacteria)]|uniref:zinc ABC transporter substrate-binding protein n=1 Tax=Paracoccus sp. TaxID=267 RepID=UPI0026DED6AD|nr:zinc ABC transporter substrate-binding protein [Paracoccus sp. (in: a-proteobacteria)]MDO5612368.1 zinc ABC transporter substrate-binding protein [Paracoccus sp. (in: a-proteobacteria)]